MKTITIMANNINALSVELENFKHDNEVVSIYYTFNTVEYYKNQKPYVQAVVTYKN